MDKCLFCNGIGEIACQETNIAYGKYGHPLDCPSCKGNNKVPCPKCNGAGIIKE